VKPDRRVHTPPFDEDPQVLQARAGVEQHRPLSWIGAEPRIDQQLDRSGSADWSRQAPLS
jgi:hypothetical protein